MCEHAAFLLLEKLPSLLWFSQPQQSTRHTHLKQYFSLNREELGRRELTVIGCWVPEIYLVNEVTLKK